MIQRYIVLVDQSDDTMFTGHEHISVTLKEDGDYPSFTIKTDDIKKLD